MSLAGAREGDNLWAGELKIELKVHLGQKVIVKGFVLPEDKNEAGQKTHEPNGNAKNETADFRVLALKVISTTCSR